MTDSSIAIRLRAARRRADMTQTELARIVGVTNRAISKIERGGTITPARNLVLKIADTLNVSAAWLSYGHKELKTLDAESIELALLAASLSDDQRQMLRAFLEALKSHRD